MLHIITFRNHNPGVMAVSALYVIIKIINNCNKAVYELDEGAYKFYGLKSLYFEVYLPTIYSRRKCYWVEWVVMNASRWDESTVVRYLTVKAGSDELQRNITQLKKILQKCDTFKENVTKVAYWIAVSPLSLYHNLSAFLLRCFAASLLRYFAVSLPRYFAASLPHSFGALLFRCFTASPLHCLATFFIFSLFCCFAISLFRFLSTSLLCCFTAMLPHYFAKNVTVKEGKLYGENYYFSYNFFSAYFINPAR